MGRLTTFVQIRSHLDGASISTYMVVMLIVPLRIWCRISSIGRQGLGWDDVLTLVALVFVNAWFFVVMLGLRPYQGLHVDTEVPRSGVITYLEILFYAQLLYTCCISAVKAAILAFYWRLFSVKSRIPILIVGAVCAMWFFAVTFTVIFACDPVQSQWDITITDRKCIKTRTIWLSASIVNVTTDAILLILPLPYVWTLNAPVAQRIALGCMFMLGCFVSVVSMVRLSVLMSLDLLSSDVTFNFSEAVIWSAVEIHCGMICACLPCLRPAIRLLGLQYIFGSISSRGNVASNEDGMATPGTDSNGLTSWKNHIRRPRGPYTLTDLTFHAEDEEDSHDMTKKHHDGKRLTTAAAEPGRRIWSEGRSDGSERLGSGIEVKSDWTVLEEDARGLDGV